MRIKLLLLALLLAGGVYADVLFQESFTDCELTGWTRDPGQTGQRWIVSSQHYFDAPYGVLCEEGDQQDERLISPAIHLTSDVAITFN